MRILLTGFEPFAGSLVNPSQQVVERIAAAPPPGIALAGLVLPVVYYRAADLLRDALDAHRPDLWLGIGQGPVAGLSVEQVGLNLNHARIGDNEGNMPVHELADPESPAAFFTTIPVRELVDHLREQGVPAQVSLSAGTFLCNHALFAALQYTAARGLPVRCGFIHVPLLPEQAAALTLPELRPSMSLDSMEHGLCVALAWLSERLAPIPAGEAARP